MLYMIQGASDGPVHVGYIENMDRLRARVATLQAAHHEPLSVLAVAACGRTSAEKITEALSAHRLMGNWYRWTVALKHLHAAMYRGNDDFDAVAWLEEREEAIEALRKRYKPKDERPKGPGPKSRKRARLDAQIASGEVRVKRVDE